MNFDNEEDIMKAIKNGGFIDSKDLEDELAKLEAENTDLKKKKSGEGNLSDIERELEEEEEKSKKKANTKPKKPENDPDMYSEISEKKYHSVEKMVCLTVLEKEKELCNKIIRSKKKIEADYNYWNIKKKNIDDKIKEITNYVNDGKWDFDTYKNKINLQYQWEEKLLQFVEKDPALNDQQKKVLKDRLNERKKIIEEELKQSPEEEEKKEDTQKGMIQKEYKIEEINNNDLYPEKYGERYHSVDKMICLTALEKEKELSDKIIEYKKKIGADFNFWEKKKKAIDDKIQEITNYVNDGKWDLETYKNKIKEQYQWEERLLQFIGKDPALNDQQKNIIKDRLNERKKIIEEELKKNPEEEGDKEESKGNDLYPEKTEKKYHSIDKMTCLTVLEKEKELCDKIIEYKKEIEADYDDWDKKKEIIDNKIQEINDYVNGGLWDANTYKKKIEEQYQLEVKLLQIMEIDPDLNDEQKKIIKDRVNERKKIIEGELSQM